LELTQQLWHFVRLKVDPNMGSRDAGLHSTRN
jgi:hypothetical protein